MDILITTAVFGFLGLVGYGLYAITNKFFDLEKLGEKIL